MKLFEICAIRFDVLKVSRFCGQRVVGAFSSAVRCTTFGLPTVFDLQTILHFGEKKSEQFK
jgi:hypothetical protein